MREVLHENRSKPDNHGMMSECVFDGVVETMKFKNLTDQVAQACTAERQATSLEKHTKLRCQLCGAEGAEECVLTLRSTACEALWRQHQLW